MKKQKVKWLDNPEDHDYPAAISYLSLIFTEVEATRISSNLKKASIKKFKAKDIFRASKLSLLGISNSHVTKNIKKIKLGVYTLVLMVLQQANMVNLKKNLIYW